MRNHRLVLAALTAAVLLLVPLVLLALQPVSAQKRSAAPNKEIETDHRRPFDARAAVAQLEHRLATLTARVATLEALDGQGNLSDASSTGDLPVDAHPRGLMDLLAHDPAGAETPSTHVAATPPDHIVPLEERSVVPHTKTPAPAETAPAKPRNSQQTAAPAQEAARPKPHHADGDRHHAADAAGSAASRPRESEPPQQRAEPAAEEDPKPQLVGVKILSHPEGGVVPRLADIVAQTNTAGWPVVLVRSELDDESWWAQQSVGRQGQYIAARAHFGNEQSVRGSSFRMVILLLGTPEEAVRFQTARQFKEIPRGIRRSKEFRFVRQ
jgi:hypothetical protein